jgi:site-specific DNA-methyltransferase (adenine-specific)
MELNKIHNIDCLEFMKTLPDKCIDLVLTDPPYGIGIDGSDESIKDGVQIRKKYDWKGWDKSIPSKEVFDEILRISKNQVICGANYFNEYLPQGHKGWVFWYKAQQGLTMSDGEIIYTSFDVPTRIFILHRTHLWQENPQHPTQKPIELIKYLVSNFSKENDIVFDPFMGSGTTAIACKHLKRNYIGCEISADYCKIIEDRLSGMTQGLF